MKYITQFLGLFLFGLTVLTCSQSDNVAIVLDETTQKEFVEAFNAFHNEYYKNNNVKSVTATFVNTPSIQNIYHYNNFGDLFKIETVNLNNTSTIEYELLYENNRLVKRLYNNTLLTESIFEYENNLVVKISDFRNDELFYSTNFNYSENTFLNTSAYNCFTSVGLGPGVSCLPTTNFEYVYDNVNLIKIDKITSNEQREQILMLKYNSASSNLPSSVIQFNNEELTLTYQYFN